MSKQARKERDLRPILDIGDKVELRQTVSYMADYVQYLTVTRKTSKFVFASAEGTETKIHAQDLIAFPRDKYNLTYVSRAEKVDGTVWSYDFMKGWTHA